MVPYSDPIKIFIAYSRKDAETNIQIAPNYLEDLRTYLKPLERNNTIKIWYDGEIVPGSVWGQSIKKNLHAADIIVLLVSANSLASNYFYDKEMAEALARHEKGEAIVVPIILTHCPWEITELSELQALPKDGKPISDWEDASKAYTNVVRGLNKSVQQVRAKKANLQAENKQKEKEKEAERQRKIAAAQEQERLENLKLQTVKAEQRKKLEAERRQKELAEQERLDQLELQQEREKIAERKAKAKQKRLTSFKQYLLEADKALIHEDWTKAITAYQQSLQYYQEGDTPKKEAIQSKIASSKQKQREAKIATLKENPKTRYAAMGGGGLLLLFLLIFGLSKIGTTPSPKEEAKDTSNTEISSGETPPPSEEDGRRLDLQIQKLLKNMVTVPGGTFQMGSEDGSSDEKPVHSVTLSTFQIGKYEVTQAQWEAVMGSNPSSFKGCDECPVESVSWNDSQDFIKKLNQLTGKNFRLPTEAEWEFAARGGTKSRNYTYSGSNSIDEVAWYSSNSSSKTHPVGGKKANELGLYDMSGNVREWCNDWYDETYYSSSPSKNPPGASFGSVRVLRGGSWGSGPNVCRSAYRGRNNPNNRNVSNGFRCAKTP